MRRLLFGLTLMIVPTIAKAEWREATTPHFIIYTQGSEKSLRQRAERLEAFHNLLLASYRLPEEPRPYRVRIFVIDNSDQLSKFMERPDTDIRGFYRPQTDGPVIFIPENTGVGDSTFSSQLVLFHEYSHHFQLQNFPIAYPPWYVEGHAELVSTASFDRTGAITYGKVADHRSGEVYNVHMSASQVLLKPPSVATGTGLSYGYSWLLTHYLTFSTERKGQLAAYVAALNKGASLAEAAKAFGDLKKLDQDLSRYLEAANFPYVAVPIPPKVATEIAVRVLPEDEAAMLPLAMEYTKPMDSAEAKKFAARVAAVAATYPNSIAALTVLIRATDDAADYSTAQTAADRLVAIAPNMSRAHAMRADVLLDRAQDAKDTTRTDLAKEGRREAVKANRLDPDDPLPLISYYKSFGAAGVAAPAIAIEGLGHAVEIVPQSSGTRLTYARALISTDQRSRAADVLRPLAYSPHQDGSVKLAFHMLARLEGREQGNPLGPIEEPKPDGKPK